MIRTDNNALICDFAQYYHIFNYRELPPFLAGVLASGLPEASRIKMELNNQVLTPTQLLIALAVDQLSYILWTKTKDGEKGRNRPNSIVQIFENTKKKSETQGFETPEEFEKERNRILRGD